MADKHISIVLRAKNAMARGIASAAQSLKSFGDSARRIGAAFTKAFLVAGTAVIGFAVKALQAYSAQEKAEKSLEAAMNARGEQGAVLVNILKREASAIQDATGAADEQTLATMAQLSALGVSADRLAEAAKATVALKSVGLEGASAQRAVALAMQGNYDMLNRYIPAIRNASTEQEKAAAFADLARRGYEQQAKTLDTVSGRWGQLKNRVGDMWEEIGRAIQSNGALTAALHRAGEAVKQFGERVAAWVQGGGVEQLMMGARMFGEEFAHRFAMASNAAHIAFAAIGDGAQTAFGYVSNVAKTSADFMVAQYRMVTGVLAAAFNAVKSPSKAAFAAIGEAARDGAKGVARAGQNMLDAMAGDSGIVTKRTAAALATREKLEADHAKRVEAINQEMIDQLARQSAQRNEQGNPQDDADALDAARIAEEEAKAAKAAAEARLKAEEDVAKKIEALKDQEKQAKIKAEEDALEAAKKALEEKKALAEKRVADVIAEAQKEKDIEKDKAKEAGRMAELEKMKARGIKLSKRQQERLDAFNRIKEAQEGIPPAEQAVVDAQKRLEDIQGKQLAALEQIQHDLAMELANQQQLLRLQ
jgi:hypothetical protein